MARPDTARTDAELLRAHVAGDRFAFEELFHRHRGRLRRVARRASGSAEDADDALQDALLSAHRGARSFRNESTVGSWLHRIVVNACRDRLRRNSIRPTTALDPALCLAQSDPVAQVDTAIMVRQALARIPADQRVAVVTVDMQGYSVAAAAVLLGVPEGTVKSRCARGRARLSRLLSGVAPTGG
ncbi:MAG: RNA polymerase sigma factor SigM [Mycobacterium sp.]